MMSDRTGIFAGDDPFCIARAWLAEASEPNDPNAIALATVDPEGLPDVRMVLLKEIEADAFVFYTNYDSAKGRQIEASGKAAFVMHWKSLRRQIRVRGSVTREDGPQADEYYDSRSLQSRIGAWASRQSQPLESRTTLMAAAAQGHERAARRLRARGGFDTVLIADSPRLAISAAAELRTENSLMPRLLGTELWSGEADIPAAGVMQGALFSAVSDARYRNFSDSYRSRFGNAPYRIATLGYDSVLLALRVAGNNTWRPGTPFPTSELTARGGFLGLDGAFRFEADGTAQRALEVREVRDGQVVVVSPAPDNF